MSVWEKLRTNLVLDWQLLATPPPRSGSRTRTLWNKYAAILRNRREIDFMGVRFRYDNRFTPALLPGYLHEIQRLARHVPLAALRTAIDVGANAGQFAFALKLYCPTLEVWSFEPNPPIFDLLAANTRGFSDWHAVPTGIGTKGKVRLFFVPGKSSQGSVYAENAKLHLDGSRLEEVVAEIEPLDEDRAHALGIPGEVDLLKIDVEGAELEALEHVTGIRPRWVLIEISVGREGVQPIDAFVATMKRIWTRDARALWRSDVRHSHGTQDWLFELSDVPRRRGA